MIDIKPMAKIVKSRLRTIKPNRNKPVMMSEVTIVGKHYKFKTAIPFNDGLVFTYNGESDVLIAENLTGKYVGRPMS